MSALTAVIVDDEPLAREGIRLRLERTPDVEVVGEAARGDRAVEVLRDQRPDLLFLDVRLPDATGLDVLRRLHPDPIPVTVLVTAHDEYAVTAFDLDAADYLLKPFDDERFERALERACRRIRDRREGTLERRIEALLDAEVTDSRTDGPLERLLVRDRGKTLVVPVAEVAWVEADRDYMRVHARGRVHLLRTTLGDLEERLPDRFVRVHRSALVNLDRVRAFHSLSRGDWRIELEDGSTLRMSRTYRRVVEERLGGPLSGG